ncbi:hypothetical protein [Streptomyces sp. NPDC020298]|uniref:hypothetical protein n=1 Tax=unclassified Streptomyces TaxID=2593676 RepID=UPI00340CEE97
MGERVAAELMSATDFDAGPIVQEAKGERNTYFLLSPGTASAFRWPPGVRALTRADRGLAYVGVPALSGDTWPLGWRSTPSAGVPYVEAGLLWRAVGWVSLPPVGGERGVG